MMWSIRVENNSKIDFTVSDCRHHEFDFIYKKRYNYQISVLKNV